jgi:hypothetical protein
LGPCFLVFFGALKLKKKAHNEIVMLWQAVVWVIWHSRNDVVFSHKTRDASEAVEKIEHIAWGWLLAKKPCSPCLFYEWNVYPLDCIVRKQFWSLLVVSLGGSYCFFLLSWILYKYLFYLFDCGEFSTTCTFFIFPY